MYNIIEIIKFEIYYILKTNKIESLYPKINILDICNKHILDLKSLVAKDPSIKNIEEAIYAHSGMKALLYYRIANKIIKFKNYLMSIKSKEISEFAKINTGIEIHPSAEIWGGVVIDHGFGTVIGETVKIKSGVYILQNVILGAKGIANNKSKKRHPTIGKNVEIGANVKILGNVFIGDNVFIGPDIVITENIPPYTKIFKKNEILKIKTRMETDA